MTRKTYVYRLIVGYPPGSLEPGWEPPGWEPQFHYDYEGPVDDPFRWPANRLCFSASTAKRRADLFRKYGAEVEIERSAPVTWPADPATAATEQED